VRLRAIQRGPLLRRKCAAKCVAGRGHHL